MINQDSTRVPAAPSEFSEISFHETIRTLYTRRVTIIIVLILAMVAGGGLATMPRRYKAQGEIRIEPGKSSVYQVSSFSSMLNGENEEVIATESELIQSRTLYLRVARELNLVNDPAFWGKTTAVKQRSLDDPRTRELVYRRFASMIKVTHSAKDQIIDIDCTTISPQLSAKMVNSLINDYIAYIFEMRYGSAKRASGWLIDQMSGLKRKIEQDQIDLTKLQGELGVLGFDEKNSTYIYGESLSSLMKSADQATIDRIVAEAKLRFLKDSDPGLIEGEINILPQSGGGQRGQGLLESLRNAQAEAATKYANLASQFGPNYPDVKRQKAELDEATAQVKAEEKRILNQAQLSYDAATANEKMATSTVQREKSKIFDSHDAMVKYILLSQDYESDRTLYEGLIQHLQEAGMTSGLEAGDIDIVDIADIPALPQRPGPILIMVGATMCGLIVGSFLALWLASLDQRIRSADQVEKLTGLPILARLPHVDLQKEASGSQKKSLLPIAPARSHYAEALQILRTSLLLTRAGSPPKVILITSAAPADGKSTTIINLGATFARHNARVLLVDCDLRRGTIGSRLGLQGARGVTNILTRQASLDDAIQQIKEVPGLYVLPSGPHPPDPSVLVGSEQMRTLIEECKERFDFVIIDSPPVLGIADGLELGQLADNVVMVVRESFSNGKAIRDSVYRMASSHLPTVGFVYNDVDVRALGYGYGYRYYQSYYRDYYREEGAE